MNHLRSAIGVVDWDGDGRQDVLVNVNGYVAVMYSTGTGFSAPAATSIPDSGTFVLNADGDKAWDIGSVTGSAITYHLHGVAGQNFPDTLSSITDGYGVTNTPTYVSISQSNYSTGTTPTYPETIAAGPLTVVGSVITSDGVNGIYTRGYTYLGARADVSDRDYLGTNFLGFQSITVADSRPNAPVVKTYYATAFPYIGMVSQKDTYQNNGTLISHTANTLSLTTLDGTANNQRYFPYVSSTTTDSYEVGGAKNGVLITQSSASFTYDNYGNQTSSISTVVDKDSAAPASPTYNQSWTTTVTNTITPDTANWCLPLPTQIRVVKSATGVAAITRTTSFTPDYAKCRIAQKVVEPASSKYKVTTDFGYDSFGNVNAQTVTGIGMTARNTTVNWGATGQFPISTTNALSQTTQAGYDYGKGVQTSQTDPNGLVTSWQYDNFGRKTLETKPDGTSTAWSYNDCASVSGGCLNGDPGSSATGINKMVVIATAKDTAGTTLRDDWTYLDQLDRTIVTKSMTLAGTYSRVGVQYDTSGRKLRQTMPCDAASCATYWQTYSYDALNRVTQVVRPISASNLSLQNTVVAYQGMTTVTTDPKGRKTTNISDPTGWMRRSQDANGYYQNFTYDAFGSVKTVVDSLGNALFSASYAYGADAFQTQTVDMDLGTWNYTPNALGEVAGYTDAKGSAFTLTYDFLSRPLTRFVAGDGTTTWTWGTSAASVNIGQLQSITNTGGTTENYTYDNKGRLSQRQIISDATYNYNYSYSATTGLLDILTYPTSTSGYRLAVKHQYQHGILQKINDNNGSAVFWQANAMSPRGQVTQETLGNGIITNRNYDAVTGWVNSIQSGIGGGTGVQNEAYLFDKVGNVTQRQNNTLGLTESFYYDNVNRLDYSQLNGVTNLDITYNGMGNITSRTDVASNATWTYDATKKHAVTQAGSASYTYTYDANGNAITRNGYAIGWNKANYPTSLGGSGETISLYYDGNNQRWKQVYVNGATTETTLYVGELLEKVTTGSTVDWRHTIKVGSQTVAFYSRQSTGAAALRYVLEDHQGSVAKITSTTGATYVSENFSAYGARRNPSTWSGAPTATDLTNLNAVSREGYTGQDALGSLGLNHMNGRVQDAITGRFLSADPYITEPQNTQNYNRYSYVDNNPLSYTDPSGFCKTGEVSLDYECYIDTLPVFLAWGNKYNDDNNTNYGNYNYSINYGNYNYSNNYGNYNYSCDSSCYGGNGTGGVSGSNGSLEEIVVTATKPKKQEKKPTDWNQFAIDWMPGYGLGTCINGAIGLGASCGGGDWAMGVIGGIPFAGEAKVEAQGALAAANRIAHVFQDKHMLDPLVKAFGSKEAALGTMQKAAQSLSGTAYQTGTWVSIRVGEFAVAIKGAVINGEFRLSTATMRPFQ